MQTFLFGPGAMTLDQAYFGRILASFRDDPAAAWASDAVQDLRASWPLLVQAVPKLQNTPGRDHAAQLLACLQSGALPPQASVASLPNALLGPLVVLAQLAEYLQYADAASASYQPPKAETVGCCLGVFSALVVSASASWAQFRHNAAAVLRTVFVLGALSDAQDVVSATGPSVSLLAFWRSGQSLADLEALLAPFPAYVSVLYDGNRATVTTSVQTSAAVQAQLQKAGITTTETEFHGRFHAGSLYKDDLAAFLALAEAQPLFRLPTADGLVLPTRINSADIVAPGADLLATAVRAFLVDRFCWIDAVRAAVAGALQDATARLVEFGPEHCVPPTLLRRLHSQVVRVDVQPRHEDDIAVVGMACRVAGAEDVEGYWKILVAGESQHRDLVPNDRFAMATQFRPDGQDGRRWFGNMLDDCDAFDGRFFKKSPREALHMDPQQRMLLQTAYQAVAQSGYFHGEPDQRVGCYVGCVANDYENNISHTDPTAFSGTGALRSYIAGKVSHFFGWTGPGMTVDTACSASTVAISLACGAILRGECSAALAAGTNVFCTPMFFQNLAAGSFLSPTGACKPFDAAADGYCRGEAVGAVFLKRRSQAEADGDLILGVIAATAINQNANDTPIFVPNPTSLTQVFRTVLDKAGLEPADVSVVEAHGTGTPVGDPVEYDSIRQVFGGAARTDDQPPLHIGSVKGLVGHTEGASGVVALVKLLLMMHHGVIPPQASFTALSPAIHASPADHMAIATAPIPWETPQKVALINNYGAAGSNASMIIKQQTKKTSASTSSVSTSASSASVSPASSVPLRISGLDDKAVSAYAARLRRYLQDHRDLDLENVAFNVNRQANWSLGRSYIFSAASLDELDEKLASPVSVATETPPVILAFGGQVSRAVGLDRAVFDKSAILRKHLDDCDRVCQAIGAGSIYPGIFSREPIADPAVLQPLLFSMQYAVARSWIDAGLQPAALVGHSFGELTALSISGILSLDDALRLVYGRACIIRDGWGESGAMVAVEGDRADVEKLVEGTAANIACFNGPRSFTLAGPTSTIDSLTDSLKASFPKHKRLDVTHAFHSTLVDPLTAKLEALGRTLHFQPPRIPLEHATSERLLEPLSASFVAQHMRQPVYFSQAVQRLAADHPGAVWLEAGSRSTITAMASRALSGLSGTAKPTFHPVDITNTDRGTQQLVDTTMHLWKAGLPVDFWPHARAQTAEYTPLLLPPYQFEKQRYWLPFKAPESRASEAPPATLPAPQASVQPLFTALDVQDDLCRFRLHPESKDYPSNLSAVFLVDVAIQALASVRPALSSTPQVTNLSATTSVVSSLLLTLQRDSHASWSFHWTTEDPASLQVRGQLHFYAAHDPLARLARLVPHDRCLGLLHTADPAADVVQGPQSLRALLGDNGRCLQKLVGRARESAASVVERSPNAFLRVGSVWTGTTAVASIEQWTRATTTGREWHVLAQHQRTEGDSFLTDLFVFDAASGELQEAMLGVRYVSGDVPLASVPAPLLSAPLPASLPVLSSPLPAPLPSALPPTPVAAPPDLWKKLLPVLADISGLEEAEIAKSDTLADIGIDSLMGMEMAREVEKTFQCTLDQSELMSVYDIPGILDLLQSVLGHDVPSGSTSGSASGSDAASASGSASGSDTSSVSVSGYTGDLPTALLDAFHAAKATTDDLLRTWGCAGYLTDTSPKQTRLCLVLTASAFRQLGCDLATAQPGQVLPPVPYVARHRRFHEYLYKMLQDTRIIDVDDHGTITRTALPLPSQTAEDLLADLLRHHPADAPSHQLTYNVGQHMAEVLSGQADGPQLIFGDARNRELVAAFYGELPFNRLYFDLMADFLRRLVARLGLSAHSDVAKPLRILEMGAGTGGTTKVLVPVLASLGIPVEYTFTDLSPSLVAQAKKKFKQYPFMKFAVHDIEQPTPNDPQLLASQHLVFASNAVHATHSLQNSAASIRRLLRPDGGALVLLEMNSTLHWVDVVWGTLEGWWLFDDGRTHAVVDEKRWKKDLLAAGYSHVDWTDGELPEARVQRVIVALTGPVEEESALPVVKMVHAPSPDEQLSRRLAADQYVEKAIQGFSVSETTSPLSLSARHHVLVTGATGSLGSHLVAHLARLPSVDRVYCLNRPPAGSARNPDHDPLRRQLQAMEAKSIVLDDSARAKIHALETDSARPQLGLAPDHYRALVHGLTHVVHNAFPVNGMLSLKQNAPQFAVMRNLVDLAAAASHHQNTRCTFLFISSLSAVGLFPAVPGGAVAVPEQPLPIDSALPNGYGGAKIICERILRETLGRHPQRFRACTVRLGQLSGSADTGYWNHMEVLGFLFKSAQTLRCLPAVDGVLSWLPLEVACGALGELLGVSGPLEEDEVDYAVYHVDNPRHLPWADLLPLLADELGVPATGLVPLDEWLRRVRAFPGENPWDNPAAKAIDFFAHKFEHMSCGGVTLATENAQKRSSTLREAQPVSEKVVRGYFQAWRESGFLH